MKNRQAGGLVIITLLTIALAACANDDERLNRAMENCVTGVAEAMHWWDGEKASDEAVDLCVQQEKKDHAEFVTFWSAEDSIEKFRQAMKNRTAQ